LQDKNLQDKNLQDKNLQDNIYQTIFLSSDPAGGDELAEESRGRKRNSNAIKNADTTFLYAESKAARFESWISVMIFKIFSQKNWRIGVKVLPKLILTLFF
jgi:hypothetical protein